MKRRKRVRKLIEDMSACVYRVYGEFERGQIKVTSEGYCRSGTNGRGQVLLE